MGHLDAPRAAHSDNHIVPCVWRRVRVAKHTRIIRRRPISVVFRLNRLLVDAEAPLVFDDRDFNGRREGHSKAYCVPLPRQTVGFNFFGPLRGAPPKIHK